jgi:hypothetical protein
MKYHDVAPVLLGFSTAMLSIIRKPKMGNDQYAEMLATAYNIPTLLATKYANEIESYDTLVADANRDGNTQLAEVLKLGANALAEGARRLVNGLSNSFGLGTFVNWDQTQDYDIDFLDELASLGEIVAKLNRRNRLMASQALISASMNVFQIGDSEEGDSEDGDTESQVGDLLSSLALRRLPPNIMGRFNTLSAQAKGATLRNGQAMLNKAGYAVNKSGIQTTSNKPSKLRKVMQGVLTGNPTKATLIASLAGLVTGLGIPKMLLKKLHGDPSEAGDIQAGLYGDIQNEFGDAMADAWMDGDVEGMVANALGDIDEFDAHMGDTDMGDAAFGAALDSSTGDVEGLSPETGGLFAKFRANNAIKKQARQHNRAVKKGARIQAKGVRKMTRQTGKLEARQAAAEAKATQRQPQMDYQAAAIPTNADGSYSVSPQATSPSEMAPDIDDSGSDLGVTQTDDGAFAQDDFSQFRV